VNCWSSEDQEILQPLFAGLLMWNRLARCSRIVFEEYSTTHEEELAGPGEVEADLDGVVAYWQTPHEHEILAVALGGDKGFE